MLERWLILATCLKKINEHEENAVGDFAVRFAMVKDGMKYISLERRVKVVELEAARSS